MRGKAIYFVILTVAVVKAGLAQHKGRPAPFIVQGRVTNCTEKKLVLYFKDESYLSLQDTIYLDENGKFYLKSLKVVVPQLASIQSNNIQINDLFIAPGYNLTITGNGQDFMTLLKTTKISGTGEQSNNYRTLLNATLIARADTTKWYELDSSQLLTYIDNDKRLKDSIWRVVFNKKMRADKYGEYFKRMVQLNNLFEHFYKLLVHVNFNRYSSEQKEALVKGHFKKSVPNDLFKEEYMISGYYRSVMLTDLPRYLINADYAKDSSLRKDNLYVFEKIDKVYKGKIKEYALYYNIWNRLFQCNSIEKLNEYKIRLAPYITAFRNKAYQTQISDFMTEKESRLTTIQPGKVAPSFVLPDTSDIIYRLNDFKNKVVYIDVWASWCGPCRIETPYLKVLYEKYKKDSGLVVISIATNDSFDKWKKALDDDKPDWLQLYDKEGLITKLYLISSIPRFILIDKQGRIVNANAPRPSEKEKIEKLLKEELEK